MKKIVSLTVILMIMAVATFTVNVYACQLSSINVEISKDSLKLGEKVRVNIEY